MFAIPVKIVEVSGGGGDLPLMTWNPDDPYYDYYYEFNPSSLEFTNLNKTFRGSFVSARSNYPIVPDRWYCEIQINSITALGYYSTCGITNNSSSLGDVYAGSENVWAIGQDTLSSVLAYSGSSTHLLSLNGGTTLLESLVDGDIVQFAGRRSTNTLWIGLNGDWLSAEHSAVWTLGDPESETNPVFTNLPDSPYPACRNGDDGGGGSTPERFTLLTHTDDLVYAPPTGFSAVSGEATVTYLHVLRDRNIMPISQPTDHTLMGSLGL